MNYFQFIFQIAQCFKGLKGTIRIESNISLHIDYITNKITSLAILHMQEYINSEMRRSTQLAL